MMNNARLMVGVQGVGQAELRAAAGDGLRARAPAGPRARRERRGHEPDRRASRYPPHADDDARADRGVRAPSAIPARSPSTRAQPMAMPIGRSSARAASCSRRSPRRSPPTSPSRSPRSACRCMAAWASSRRPARRRRSAMRASAPIYEGTNGIQAIDLVTRKLPMADGAVVGEYIDELQAIAERARAREPPGFRPHGRAAGHRARRSCRPRRDHLLALFEAAGRRKRSPARRPICGSSALPRAAPISPRARSRRSPTATAALHARASPPRASSPSSSAGDERAAPRSDRRRGGRAQRREFAASSRWTSACGRARSDRFMAQVA